MQKLLDQTSQSEEDDCSLQAYVALRIKPSNNPDMSYQQEGNIFKLTDCNQYFSFKKIFNEKQTNHTIFDTMIKPMLDKAIQGHKILISNYGQTCTGKTYTIWGSNCEFGILQYSVKYLLEQYIQPKLYNQSCVKMRYYEINDHEIIDLLSNDRNKIKHRILAESKEFYTLEKFVQICQNAQRNRDISSTLSNNQSSKSNFLLEVLIKQNIDNQYLNCSICFADLVGNEEQECYQGILEYGHILKQLASGQFFDQINFKNSKLTYVLEDYLKLKTIMGFIIHINQEQRYRDQTLSTLNFSQIASQLVSNLELNLSKNCKIDIDNESKIHFQQLYSKIDELEQKLKNQTLDIRNQKEQLLQKEEIIKDQKIEITNQKEQLIQKEEIIKEKDRIIEEKLDIIRKNEQSKRMRDNQANQQRLENHHQINQQEIKQEQFQQEQNVRLDVIQQALHQLNQKSDLVLNRLNTWEHESKKRSKQVIQQEVRVHHQNSNLQNNVEIVQEIKFEIKNAQSFEELDQLTFQQLCLKYKNSQKISYQNPILILSDQDMDDIIEYLFNFFAFQISGILITKRGVRKFIIIFFDKKIQIFKDKLNQDKYHLTNLLIRDNQVEQLEQHTQVIVNLQKLFDYPDFDQQNLNKYLHQYQLMEVSYQQLNQQQQNDILDKLVGLNIRKIKNSILSVQETEIRLAFKLKKERISLMEQLFDFIAPSNIIRFSKNLKFNNIIKYYRQKYKKGKFYFLKEGHLEEIDFQLVKGIIKNSNINIYQYQLG